MTIVRHGVFRRWGARLGLLGALLMGSSGSLAAPPALEERLLGDDRFLAGERVELGAATSGDVIAAGGTVRLDAGVGGDAVLAGGEVTVSGAVADDVYAAGAEVELAGRVDGNARLAGGKVRVSSGAEVGGGLSVAGAEVVMAGRAGRYLSVAGREVVIEGTVDGDVEVSAAELRVGPRAVIQGAIRYRGEEPAQVAAGATVAGGVHQNLEPEARGIAALSWMIALGAIAWFVGWLALGVLWWSQWPASIAAAAEVARRRAPAALAVGFAVLVGTPAAGVLLFLSGVGAPLALMLAPLYLLALPLGYFATALRAARWLLARARPNAAPRLWSRTLSLAAVLVVFALLGSLPVLGWLGSMAITALGLGSLLLLLTERSGSAAARPRREREPFEVPHGAVSAR